MPPPRPLQRFREQSKKTIASHHHHAFYDRDEGIVRGSFEGQSYRRGGVDRAFGTGEYSEDVGELLGVFDDLVVVGGSTAEGGTSSDPGVGGDAWTPPPGSGGDDEVGDSGVCNKTGELGVKVSPDLEPTPRRSTRKRAARPAVESGDEDRSAKKAKKAK